MNEEMKVTSNEGFDDDDGPFHVFAWLPDGRSVSAPFDVSSEADEWLKAADEIRRGDSGDDAVDVFLRRTAAAVAKYQNARKRREPMDAGSGQLTLYPPSHD
jgi:hypothetical protein